MKKLIYSCFVFALFFGCSDDGVDGTNGKDGINGFNSLVSVTGIPVGSQDCPNGGNRIDTGIDDGSGVNGIAANDVLETGEIDDTAFICNGTDGKDNSVNTEEDFYFANFGSNRYDAFTTVSISDRYPDENEVIGLAQDNTTLVEVISQIDIYVDKSIEPDSISRVRSLLRFPGLAAFFNELLEPGSFSLGNVELKEAVLYMQMNEAPFALFGSVLPSDIDFIPFGPASLDDSTYPLLTDYIPSETTWNEEQQGIVWPKPGVFNSSDAFGRDDKDFITNTGIGKPQWFAFKLDTATVKKWLLNEGGNKGVFMTVDEEFAINRGSLVNVQMGFRDVLLYLNIRHKNVSNGRRRNFIESITPWEERPFNQKVKPLYNYLKNQ